MFEGFVYTAVLMNLLISIKILDIIDRILRKI